MPIILRQNENLIKTFRRHWIFLMPAFIIWFLIIVIFFAVRYGFKFDFFGYWSWAIVFLILIILLIISYKIYLWRYNALVITDQRVVKNDQRGFFSQTVTELLYRDILEISYDKNGMGASMYNYGDIKIRTASENEIVIAGIAKPEEVVEMINKARVQSGG